MNDWYKITMLFLATIGLLLIGFNVWYFLIKPNWNQWKLNFLLWRAEWLANRKRIVKMTYRSSTGETRYYTGDFHDPEKIYYCSVSNCTCKFCLKHRKQNINLN